MKKVIIKCSGCGEVINSTVSFEDDDPKLKEIYNDALLNPLIGWCDDCDRKPFPEIVSVTPPTNKNKSKE